jgi:hypothetical protein
MFATNRTTRLEALQAEIHRQLETIVTALIVSEPRTGLAAEAFDGLRRNIAFAAQERRRQLSQLVTFTDAIERGATIDTLRARCEQWCAEAGLQRHADPAAEPDWFQVVEGEGPVIEPIEPAWIDSANRVLVKPGTARRAPAPEPAPAPAAAVTEPATDEPATAAAAPAEPAADPVEEGR